METTEFSCNSLAAKMFFRCLETAGTFTSKSSAIFF